MYNPRAIGFSVDKDGKVTPMYETTPMVMVRFWVALCVVGMLAFSLFGLLDIVGLF